MIVLKKSQPVPVLTRPSTTEQKTSKVDPASLSTLLADVRSALAAIPNQGEVSLAYDEWFGVMCGIHHATDGSAEGLALAHEFSSRSEKYNPDELEERIWPYIRSERSGKVITENSLFARARQYGWQENVLDQFDDLGPLEEPSSAESPPAGAAGVAAPAKPERFTVIPIGEFIQRKPPGWIVKGVLPRVELVLIIGESGSGKSFFAWDMSAAIARGVAWRDLKTVRGRVILVVAEGSAFFHQRALAYAKHHNVPLGELGIGVICDAPNLLQKDDVGALVQQVRRFGKVDIIVVDTLAQATPGMNENASEDVGTVLANCKVLHRATGAVVVLVHHVGKDESRGARGHSSLKAAADAEITVTRRDDARTAIVSKMKDAADGLELPFKLVEVELGKDEDGDAITSCIVEHGSSAPEGRRVRQPTGDIAKHVLQAAHDLALLGGNDTTVSALLGVAVQSMPQDPERRDRRREIAMRALQGLQTQGFLRVDNGRVLLPEAS